MICAFLSLDILIEFIIIKKCVLQNGKNDNETGRY